MTTWAFTEHACRACLGQILQSGGSFICAICRVTAEGTPEAICGCGVEIFGPTTKRRVGLRCIPNPAPTPANPSHVLIGVTGVPAP